MAPDKEKAETNQIEKQKPIFRKNQLLCVLVWGVREGALSDSILHIAPRRSIHTLCVLIALLLPSALDWMLNFLYTEANIYNKTERKKHYKHFSDNNNFEFWAT